MKSIIQATDKLIKIILFVCIGAYSIYFSYFSILRYKTLYSSYYDLGIMNQTVFNTYRAIVEKNPSRILEMTDPMTGTQVKRMSIHNDILLTPLSLFYFIHAGPETLLVVQSLALGLGALAVFAIAQVIFQRYKRRDVLALLFSISYLLYPALERSNMFDFHAVTLATPLIFWMIYAWFRKKYLLSFIFFIFAILSKEQVGLTMMFFGTYAVLRQRTRNNFLYGLSVVAVSIFWVIVSFMIITPYFRGTTHFAVSYYGDFGDSPFRIVLGIFKNPSSVIKDIFNGNTVQYILNLLGPIGFLSLLSPLHLAIAAPEFAINLLSNNGNMRSINFQYTAILTPFVFLSAMYGAKKISKRMIPLIIAIALIFIYWKGPLPFMREQEIHPFKYPQHATKEIAMWAQTLKDPSLKIAATGQIAPLFSSRRYLYLFSQHYASADYVVITQNEIYNYPEKNTLIPVFDRLRNDPRFKRIYQSADVEVYKKI